MSEPTTLLDAVPPLTWKQDERLRSWLEEVNARSEAPHRPHDLAWTVRDELRPGRGHDLIAVAICSDYVHTLTMDPYGNGADSWGHLDCAHNSAYEECDCAPCKAEMEGDDG